MTLLTSDDALRLIQEQGLDIVIPNTFTSIGEFTFPDKQLTSELLAAAGLSVPPQQVCTEVAEAEAFLAEHGRVVVKPLVGEQGQGVAVDIRTPEVLRQAFATAGRGRTLRCTCARRRCRLHSCVGRTETRAAAAKVLSVWRW